MLQKQDGKNIDLRITETGWKYYISPTRYFILELNQYSYCSQIYVPYYLH
jgi:hypothetical protein